MPFLSPWLKGYQAFPSFKSLVQFDHGDDVPARTRSASECGSIPNRPRHVKTQSVDVLPTVAEVSVEHASSWKSTSNIGLGISNKFGLPESNDFGLVQTKTLESPLTAVEELHTDKETLFLLSIIDKNRQIRERIIVVKAWSAAIHSSLAKESAAPLHQFARLHPSHCPFLSDSNGLYPLFTIQAYIEAYCTFVFATVRLGHHLAFQCDSPVLSESSFGSSTSTSPDHRMAPSQLWPQTSKALQTMLWECVAEARKRRITGTLFHIWSSSAQSDLEQLIVEIRGWSGSYFTIPVE